MTLLYRKPAFWIIIIALVACAVTAVFLLTDTISENRTDAGDANKFEYITEISELYGTYHPDEVIYVNPLSSFYPFDLENTPYYTIAENEFTIVSSVDSSEITNNTPLYTYLKLTMDEFNELFSTDIGRPDVSQYDSLERITLTDRYSLFVMGADFWIADCNGEKIWLIYKLQKIDTDSSELVSKNNKLTIDDLISIVENKKDTLTWSDFENYEHYDMGSGLYIWQIPINDSFCVLIGGGSLTIDPMYARLVGLSSDGEITDYVLELREDNISIQSFVDDFSEDLRHLTWTYIPQMSFVFPALPISINMDYSTVEVAVDNGSLYIHGNKETKMLGDTHTYKFGETIYWSPPSEDSYETADELLEAIEDGCLLRLSIKNKQGDIISECQVNVQKISDESELDYSEYSVEIAAGYNSEFALNMVVDSWSSFEISLK